MKKLIVLLKNIILRFIGIGLLLGSVVVCPLFFIFWIILGINQTNVLMSSIMRVPMNLAFGDGVGDDLLDDHKWMRDQEL